jgi:protoheme IX farnesyltransferase
MNPQLIDKSVLLENINFKIKQLYILLKFRLSFLVVFSGCFGYLLATNNFHTFSFTSLVIGSFMITGAANTINQILEKDLDKLMNRTKLRPLPMGHISVNETIIFAFILAFAGAIILAYFVNILTATLSVISLLLYAFVYTPMKQISPVSVLIGAFPGALPPLIGWVAATNEISREGLIIFAIQFIWQFPHFWAIAWLGNDDYLKAGFKMLPSKGGKDFKTSFLIAAYAMFLLPVGILPAIYGITGHLSAIVASLCAILFLYPALELIKTGEDKAARKILFGSFFYLPIVQIAYLLDKI